MNFKLWLENFAHDVFYHVTRTDAISSIMKDGLIPSIGERSVKLNEKPSIFLFKSVDDVENAMMNWLGDEFGDDSVTLLEIKIPDHIKVYPTSAGYEYQVFDSISPEYIKNLGEI